MDAPARLELAFALYVVELILDADDVRTPAEQAYWESLFPADKLRAAGFVGDDGRRLSALDDAQSEALRRLPHTLATEDKLALLSSFYGAGMADGALHPAEMKVLSEGARFLAVPPAAFTQLMVDASLAALRKTRA
jgi:uncharacterized tellurite resistance protein B-like protein